jgi:hypothetical protein
MRVPEMKYIGIDLHSNNCVVSVADEEGRVVAEKRLPNDLAKIVGFLSPWKPELAGVVVESTYNWYWLVDGLQEAGFIVHLANTTAIKKYNGLKHSGDETDARHLAQTRISNVAADTANRVAFSRDRGPSNGCHRNAAMGRLRTGSCRAREWSKRTLPTSTASAVIDPQRAYRFGLLPEPSPGGRAPRVDFACRL